MARRLYVTNAVQDDQGNELLNWAGAAYTTQANAVARTSPLTDLQNSLGAPITSLVTDAATGNCVFFGPDGVNDVWVNFGFGAFLLEPADLGPRVAAIEQALVVSPTTITYANMPTGSVFRIVFTGSTAPTRPSARTDIYFEWIGPVAPTTALVGDTFELNP